MFTDGIFYNGYKELLTGDGTEVILTFLDTDILIEFAATISEYRNLSERLFILCQIAKKKQKKKKKKTKKKTEALAWKSSVKVFLRIKFTGKHLCRSLFL